jgi:phosphopantetheinyl transferase
VGVTDSPPPKWAATNITMYSANERTRECRNAQLRALLDTAGYSDPEKVERAMRPRGRPDPVS